MSPALQSEVVLRCNEQWLRGVSFLAVASEALLVDLALSLQNLLFAPGELVPPGDLNVVQRGLALYGGRLLARGEFWGADVLISSPTLRHNWCVCALNYLEVAQCPKAELEDILSAYPEDAAKVRSSTIWLALRRAVVYEAREARARLRAESGAGPRHSEGWLKHVQADLGVQKLHARMLRRGSATGAFTADGSLKATTRRGSVMRGSVIRVAPRAGSVVPLAPVEQPAAPAAGSSIIDAAAADPAAQQPDRQQPSSPDAASEARAAPDASAKGEGDDSANGALAEEVRNLTSLVGELLNRLDQQMPHRPVHTPRLQPQGQTMAYSRMRATSDARDRGRLSIADMCRGARLSSAQPARLSTSERISVTRQCVTTNI